MFGLPTRGALVIIFEAVARMPVVIPAPPTSPSAASAARPATWNLLENPSRARSAAVPAATPIAPGPGTPHTMEAVHAIAPAIPATTATASRHPRHHSEFPSRSCLLIGSVG